MITRGHPCARFAAPAARNYTLKAEATRRSRVRRGSRPVGRERPYGRPRRRPSFTRHLGQAPLPGAGERARKPQAHVAPGRHSR